ncbi:head maturation protease, ClpP-related [Arcanobacterium hippocoleae]|uniref:head maturation protease, ClpP-related n=1 Tax=Arcanobacterium hippocoleae TaxID=149017 RepID=UPI00333FD1D6
MSRDKPVGKFWNWHTQATDTDGTLEETSSSRVLVLSGPIAEQSWFDDEVTPALFKAELDQDEGAVEVWINSPGGDCVAAAQIYNMLTTYPGRVRVRIDGIAASAASVVAMAGDEVIMSPVSMLMIHNPATLAMGDAAELERAKQMLTSVKNSIINAYELKTGLSRAKLSRLMDEETWMDARRAVSLGFADRIDPAPNTSNTSLDTAPDSGVSFARRVSEQRLVNAINHTNTTPINPLPVEQPRPQRLPVEDTPTLEANAIDEPQGRPLALLYSTLIENMKGTRR